MSRHIEIRSGGPIESICGDRHLFCILSWLFPDDGKSLGVRFEGATVRPRAQAGGLDISQRGRIFCVPASSATSAGDDGWVACSAREHQRSSAGQRRPLSLEMEGRRFIGGCKVPISHSRFKLRSILQRCSRGPLLGVCELPDPQRLKLGRWCAPGGSECVLQKDGLMLGVSAERGCPSLRLFFGRHLKNKHLASVCPSALMLSRLLRGCLAHLSVGAGSYFALLTWRSVGEEAEWKLRSRANSKAKCSVSVRIQEQGRSRHKCLASCLLQKQQSGKRPVWRVARWLQIRGGYRRSRRRFVDASLCGAPDHKSATRPEDRLFEGWRLARSGTVETAFSSNGVCPGLGLGLGDGIELRIRFN